MARRQHIPKALTVAGSDSGGGAGIQADLKTFAALGVYGTSVITAITAQNTLGVTRVQALAPVMVKAQIDAIMSDIGADAVKTGMLANAAIVRAVAAKIREHGFKAIVVDPVMLAASGARLLVEEAVESYKRELFPLATIVTPNVPEAEVLAGMTIKSASDQKEAARVLKRLGPRYVIVKGGHLTGRDSLDLLFDGRKFIEFRAARIATRNNHGTGCTFASAIAAGLAHGRSVEDSVHTAKHYVHEAIRTAFSVGEGHGPLNHFHAFWDAEPGSKGDPV
ncbi:MAG: bifunctional hydroxymethylpyrimidine kinase/phosphomethylpyrimidine kinase [Dehalococcoidia bacterium]|nr:bifunctional hydroxymethylpyrimidine kinase/phosphomethylpyrimidine kinase [Dehalococcoidia bacterium]